MSNIKKKFLFKKHEKLNYIYHVDSFLVFKSLTERLVIGRIENDELIPLDQTVIEQCKKFNFNPDPTLFPDENNSEGETNEDSEGETITFKNNYEGEKFYNQFMGNFEKKIKLIEKKTGCYNCAYMRVKKREPYCSIHTPK